MNIIILTIIKSLGLALFCYVDRGLKTISDHFARDKPLVFRNFPTIQSFFEGPNELLPKKMFRDENTTIQILKRTELGK